MTDPRDPFDDRPYAPPTDDHDPTRPQPTVSDGPAYAPPSTPPAADAPPPPPGGPAYAHRYPAADEAGAPQAASSSAAEPTVAFASESAAPVAEAPRERSGRGRKLVAGVALIALAGAAGYGGSWLQDQRDDDGGVSSSLTSNEAVNTNLPDGTVQKVAQKVLPSVVQINVRGGDEGGSGTGIIISSDGDILTNNHVVDVAGDGGTITVAFSDGTNASAKIVGTDPVTDLAVIKVDGKSGLQSAELGSSNDLAVGQEVVAIGSPYGLESTVTEGIVSALNRPVTSSDGSGSSDKATIFPAVQTDAAINPGNSGGPLVNLNGQVIGINSAIRAGAGANGAAGSIGLGFAIPIDLAKNVARQLLDGKKVEHAQIGVTVQGAVSSDDITGIGARIEEVTPGSAGDKAGLKKGDVITAVDGHAVASNDALVASIRAYQPGQKVTLSVVRGDETEKVEVTLGSDADTDQG